MIERHHNIPISLEWNDIQENIIPLPKHEHRQLHEILNIPFHAVRKFREKTNHKLVKDKEYIKELRKIHKMFFELWKLDKLSADTVSKIAQSLANTSEWIHHKYDISKPLYDTLWDPKSVQNNLYQYHNWLRKASKKIIW